MNTFRLTRNEYFVYISFFQACRFIQGRHDATYPAEALAPGRKAEKRLVGALRLLDRVFRPVRFFVRRLRGNSDV